jgi:hypothetical protein
MPKSQAIGGRTRPMLGVAKVGSPMGTGSSPKRSLCRSVSVCFFDEKLNPHLIVETKLCRWYPFAVQEVGLRLACSVGSWTHAEDSGNRCELMQPKAQE